MLKEILKQQILVFLPAYNEQDKIGKAVSGIPRDIISEVLVVDDGSTDRTAEEARNAGAKVISNVKKRGVGSAIRQGVNFARERNFSVIVIMGGNNKDNAGEIPRLIQPIIQENFDFVQGSRFLRNGFHGNIPFHRLVATKYIHPRLFSFFLKRKIPVTDTTNGFRAIRLGMFDDKRINLEQEWLDGYELEPYIFLKAINLGYNIKEVAVSKVYPQSKKNYTKMRPIIDWWSILKPIFLIGLNFRK